MEVRTKKVLTIVTLLLVSVAVTLAFIYRWYWRDLPGQYLPFTRPWLYFPPVNDDVLASLKGDQGKGVVLDRPGGFSPCTLQVPPLASPPKPGEKIESVEVARAQKAVGVAFRCGSATPYIAEQNGKIMALVDGELQKPLLDLTMKLYRPSTGTRDWEQGLQSIAFSPDDRFLYVAYTDPTQATRLSEFPMPSEPGGTIDPESERVVLAVAQPHDVHNGGAITFGPDGYLYVGVGDGGLPCGAMNSFAKRRYGKVLRIDPRDPGGDATFGIPPDNPFVGSEDPKAPPPETWVTGVRNPWGIDVDPRDSATWIADVGENVYEEINLVPRAKAGVDLGWPTYEGPKGPREECIYEAEVAQVTELKRDAPTSVHHALYAYEHVPHVAETARCSVSGGELYLGDVYPTLRGKFLFGDLCSSEVLAIGPKDAQPLDLGVRVLLLTDLGVDPYGYIWTTGWEGGVHRLEPR